MCIRLPYEARGVASSSTAPTTVSSRMLPNLSAPAGGRARGPGPRKQACGMRPGDAVLWPFMATLRLPLLAALALVLAAATHAQDADPVIIRSGALEIRQSEFEGALEALPPEYRGYAAGPGKRQFAEDYLRMRLLALEAEKNGLDKAPEHLRQMSVLRLNLLANDQLKKLQAGITVPEAELQQAYQARLANYEQVNARHILVAFKGSPAAQAGKPELTEEQAKAKAEEIRQKLVGGASFEETAKTESDDVGSGAQGGSLGSFGRGQMVPEFEAAAFGGKVGEISPVVRTQFGFHILRVDERSTVSFDQARTELERELQGQQLQQKMQELVAGANPTFDEKFFAPAAPPAPAAPAQPEAPKQP